MDEREEDLTLTYNFEAFKNLQEFFVQKDRLFKIQQDEYSEFMNALNKPIKEFLDIDQFSVELDDLNKNCSRLETFQVRFFQKFNAFKILKFLNFAHEEHYQKANLQEQIVLLIKEQ
ncbi:hypothetical protein [Draconibacterium halophilum]|uniref:Uncharacterized protein n=1 Tax=Draconibacterium halophilum TaxID=2706887 RepID=A0A6C0RDM1_9BACT|nr:hypothetical protein [Draconibacterium halophilum]QIA07603.1 hypothetical protein G0Q07_07630 [Draconibacterium halophilum]